MFFKNIATVNNSTIFDIFVSDEPNMLCNPGVAVTPPIIFVSDEPNMLGNPGVAVTPQIIFVSDKSKQDV